MLTAVSQMDSLIEELERSYADAQERMSDPAIFADHHQAADAGRRLKELEGPHKLAQEWRSTSEDLEAARVSRGDRTSAADDDLVEDLVAVGSADGDDVAALVQSVAPVGLGEAVGPAITDLRHRHIGVAGHRRRACRRCHRHGRAAADPRQRRIDGGDEIPHPAVVVAVNRPVLRPVIHVDAALVEHRVEALVVRDEHVDLVAVAHPQDGGELSRAVFGELPLARLAGGHDRLAHLRGRGHAAAHRDGDVLVVDDLIDRVRGSGEHGEQRGEGRHAAHARLTSPDTRPVRGRRSTRPAACRPP